MAKPEWGTKRFCDDCGTRFYDLNREPATCPKCGTEVKVVAKPKARRFTKAAAKPAPATTQDNHPPPQTMGETMGKTMAETAAETTDDKGNPVAKGVENDLDDAEDGDEDKGVMEDTSDLTDDGDDVSEVMEHVEQGAEDKA